ncbi:hypothetical protein BDR26DRAFT_920854 [Obelidium mucronatum]|nr:hypothetical protein BDR26DRAFT_920854 [Obelidium mucronatum]
MQFTKSNVPNTPLRKPKSIEDIDKAMKEMDRIHETTFYSWIKSEKNIGYISTYKRDLFDRCMSEDPYTLSLVLQWLTADWTTASVAEILLKLFYSYKIESRKFTHLLAAVAKAWPHTKKEDIVNVLLIGETPTSTAKFIKHFTEGNNLVDKSLKDAQLDPWGKEEIVELVRSVAGILRWNDIFMMDFIIEYTSLVFTDPVQKAAVVVSVLAEFESLTQPPPAEPPISRIRTVSSENTLCDSDSDSDSEDSTATAAEAPTSEDEAIQREVAAILNKPKSKFRTQRESVNFGMKVFGRVLREAEVEEKLEFAADRLLGTLTLNCTPLAKFDSKISFDSDAPFHPTESENKEE